MELKILFDEFNSYRTVINQRNQLMDEFIITLLNYMAYMKFHVMKSWIIE